MHRFALAAVAATSFFAAGCGYHHIGTAPQQEARQAPLSASGGAELKDAYSAAWAQAAKQFEGGFFLLTVAGDRAFAADGTAQAGSWRFEVVGRSRGEKAFSVLTVDVGPSGVATVAPQAGGPVPDAANRHLQPALDLQNSITPANGMAIVMNEGYGRKFPPTTAVDFAMHRDDSLACAVMTYRWSAKKDGRTWRVETVINPITGRVISNGAS